jgi:hypothetical protein
LERNPPEAQSAKGGGAGDPKYSFRQRPQAFVNLGKALETRAEIFLLGSVLIALGRV